MLLLLTVFTILPIPAYCLYILLRVTSPASIMRRKGTNLFTHPVKEEKQKSRPRLPVGQSLKKTNKTR